jgi:dTDP-4-amino-4,6-dideoxygalactose transaminase
VLRPRLPVASRLLSYLRRIDSNRTYTNWGPLACELEGRLCAQFGTAPGTVSVASSGTAALVGSALAVAGRAVPSRPLAIVPAFTFIATSLAAEQCGFEPYFADVSEESWILSAEVLERHSQLGRTGLVIPVAPFGRAVPQAPWVEFSRRTGVAVIIDGGASFETIAADPSRFIGEIPVAISFHATKSFSTGEGGCVVTTDPDRARRVGEALNFGFAGSRQCIAASTNGKMSEYHAAVGLTELDGWKDKRARLLRVANRYHACLTGYGLADRLVTAPAVASCYVLFRCDDASEAERVVNSLDAADIESRRWYGGGLHHHPYNACRLRDPLPATDALAARLVALPVAPDLSLPEIRRVAAAVARGAGARD